MARCDERKVITMLTYEQAKEIGREACIDRLGREFVMQYRDTSSPAYADMQDHAYCFVGVDNTPERYDPVPLILTSTNRFPFLASCNVRYSDGAVEFLDCVLPE